MSSSGPIVIVSTCCCGPTTCSMAARNSIASRPCVTSTIPIIERLLQRAAGARSPHFVRCGEKCNPSITRVARCSVPSAAAESSACSRARSTRSASSGPARPSAGRSRPPASDIPLVAYRAACRAGRRHNPRRAAPPRRRRASASRRCRCPAPRRARRWPGAAAPRAGRPARRARTRSSPTRRANAAARCAASTIRRASVDLPLPDGAADAARRPRPRPRSWRGERPGGARSRRPPRAARDDGSAAPRKRAPTAAPRPGVGPGRFSAQMRPRCASTIWREMDRPSPEFWPKPWSGRSV